MYYQEVVLMETWEYHVNSHIIKELNKCEETPEDRKIFSCDDEGKCMVNDVCKIGTTALASALNELGKEGWELIMTNYHHGELLCIWKRKK